VRIALETVDYSTHSADLPWSMPCSCGSPDCRKKATHEDWQQPDVQDRYAGHFSPVLNRRIGAHSSAGVTQGQREGAAKGLALIIYGS
jgi:hypothetical protein